MPSRLFQVRWGIGPHDLVYVTQGWYSIHVLSYPQLASGGAGLFMRRAMIGPSPRGVLSMLMTHDKAGPSGVH